MRTVDPREDVERRGGRTPIDAVTVSFSDPAAGVHGLFRTGLDPDGRGSVFAVVFRGREVAAADARGDLDVEGGGWSALSAGGLRMEVAVPLERWRLSWEAPGARVELDVEAVSAPAVVPPVGGLEGYEQLCRVTGTVRAGGEAPQAVDGLGQRGHLWGAPDWRELELTRSLAVWLGGGDGVTLVAARARGAAGHDEETVWAALLTGGEPRPVADPRVSTTYDGDGHQRRAGLELWPGEDDAYPERVAGEVLCGSTLDLGPLRLDVAFFTWHAEGRDGVGRYDILTRA